MKNQASHTARTQAGNALFFILICIALFAALGWAVAQGFRSSGSISSMTEQQAKLAATEIVEYLNSVKNAVNTLLINGCDLTELDFTNDIYIRNDAAPVETAPPGAKASCKIFGSQGGGIKPIVFNKYTAVSSSGSAANSRPSHFAARFVPTAGFGTTENDLLFYGGGFKLDVCLAVLNLIAPDKNFTSVPVDAHGSPTSNSYTPGVANTGANFVLDIPSPNSVYAIAVSSANPLCNIGIVLKTR